MQTSIKTKIFLFSYGVCRWMVLDDQSLCIHTSSSFVYGAVPIGGNIYVVGDLDTGQWNDQWVLMVMVWNMNVKVWFWLCMQEQASITSGSFAAARGRGIAQSLCYPVTFPKQPAPPCALPTVDCSAFSWAKECSKSGSDSTVHTTVLAALSLHLGITKEW